MGRCDTTAPAEARKFGAWVRKMLQAQGVTQAEFADRIGMNAMNLNCIINGHSDLRLTTAVRIARGFGLSLAFAPSRRITGGAPREEDEG